MCKTAFCLLFVLLTAPARAENDGPDFDALLDEQNEVAEAEGEQFSALIEAAADARVELPLDRVVASRTALAAQAEARARRIGPAVVLGEAHYHGEAIEGALALTVDLQVTLGRPDVWKTVPLVGEDVVLVSARVEGRAVPVTVQSGYHVWLTQQVGTVALELTVLVPAQGPRGALDYRFTIARTPVTRFDCAFPGEDLAPRIDTAVQAEVTHAGGRTRLVATLSPELQVHLVGLKALAEAEPQSARTYVDTDGLLVLGARDDLFMTLRYTILHGGMSRFPIRLPPGYRVESVAADPNFRHTVQPDPAGDLVQGELPSPVRTQFEVALHLRRELPAEAVLAVAVPQAVGAERQSGWLAVEVPGKLRLETDHHAGISSVDVRRLPTELRESAVSPILQAWRYEAPAFDLTVGLQRLAERRIVPGIIDEVAAFTVVSDTGARLTEMRLMFKNRLRHRLAMRLPPGARLRSALLGGNPVSASLDEAGRVLLPLIRSEGEEDDFELSVVVEEDGPPPGLWGHHDLALPAVELPISSLRWSVFLPERDTYGALQGDVAEQERVGSVRWRRPFDAPTDEAAPAATPGVKLAVAGTMPVRINVPRTGHRLNYHRYWIGADRPVQLTTRYVRSWLLYPAQLGLAVVLVVLLQIRRRWLWVPAMVVSVALYALTGPIPVVGAWVLALGLMAWRRRWFTGLAPRCVQWLRTQRARLQRPSVPWTRRRVGHLAGRTAVALTVLYFGQWVVRVAAPLVWSMLD